MRFFKVRGPRAVFFIFPILFFGASVLFAGGETQKAKAGDSRFTATVEKAFFVPGFQTVAYAKKMADGQFAVATGQGRVIGLPEIMTPEQRGLASRLLESGKIIMLIDPEMLASDRSFGLEMAAVYKLKENICGDSSDNITIKYPQLNGIRSDSLRVAFRELYQQERLARADDAGTRALRGDLTGYAHLIGFLTDDDQLVRQKAASVLEAIHWTSDSVRDRVVYFLAKNDLAGCAHIGEPAKVPLDAMLKDPNLGQAAAKVLKMIASGSFAGEKLTDQKKLVKIAIEDQDPDVRSEAVKKLTDQNSLAEVALASKDPDMVSGAVRKITDQNLLFKIATEKENLGALDSLTDQDLLSKIAVGPTAASGYANLNSKAVEKIADQNRLFGIAMKGENASARATAVTKLSDQKFLAKIAVENKDAFVRKAAVEKLTDLSLLTTIALKDEGASVRGAAILKIKDPKALAQAAIEDKDTDNRISAVLNLTDCEWLNKVSSASRDGEIDLLARCAADINCGLSRRTDNPRPLFRLRRAIHEVAKRKRLSGEKVEISTARVFESYADRSSGRTGSAHGRSIDVKVLWTDPAAKKDSLSAEWDVKFPGAIGATNVFVETEMPIEGVIASFLKATKCSNEDLKFFAANKLVPELRLAAIGALDEPSLLAKIAMENKDSDVRNAAIKKVEDQKILFKISVKDKDPNVRRAAVEKLTDENFLSSIAVKDKDSDVRWVAVSQIKDQKMLAGVAVKNKYADSRKAAVEKLLDQSLLAKIAIKDKDEDVRLAAKEKVTEQVLLDKIERSWGFRHQVDIVFFIIKALAVIALPFFLFNLLVKGRGASRKCKVSSTATAPVSRDNHETLVKSVQAKMTEEKPAAVPIPWDYIRKASAQNDDFFDEHKTFLPGLFSHVKGAGRDPVLMLVAFEQEKWRALLALLYKKPQSMYLTPETFALGMPKIESNGYCDVYVAPKVSGQEMSTGIYGLEREWLVSELYWVQGLPPAFIKQVKEEKKPGSFDVVVFGAGGMCVRHMPISADVKVEEKKQVKTTPGLEELKAIFARTYRDGQVFSGAIRAAGYRFIEETPWGSVVMERGDDKFILGIQNGGVRSLIYRCEKLNLSVDLVVDGRKVF